MTHDQPMGWPACVAICVSTMSAASIFITILVCMYKDINRK
jgi:hypothetical protein